MRIKKFMELNSWKLTSTDINCINAIKNWLYKNKFIDGVDICDGDIKDDLGLEKIKVKRISLQSVGVTYTSDTILYDESILIIFENGHSYYVDVNAQYIDETKKIWREIFKYLESLSPEEIDRLKSKEEGKKFGL